MTLPKWATRAALAVYAADAAILSALVNEHVITATLSTEIGAVIAALAVGWHGSQARAEYVAKTGQPVPPLDPPAGGV